MPRRSPPRREVVYLAVFKPWHPHHDPLLVKLGRTLDLETRLSRLIIPSGNPLGVSLDVVSIDEVRLCWPQKRSHLKSAAGNYVQEAGAFEVFGHAVLRSLLKPIPGTREWFSLDLREYASP